MGLNPCLVRFLLFAIAPFVRNAGRVVRRADGYYAQFCIDHDRIEDRTPTGHNVGLDVGLNHFYTDSSGTPF